MVFAVMGCLVFPHGAPWGAWDPLPVASPPDQWPLLGTPGHAVEQPLRGHRGSESRAQRGSGWHQPEAVPDFIPFLCFDQGANDHSRRDRAGARHTLGSQKFLSAPREAAHKGLFPAASLCRLGSAGGWDLHPSRCPSGSALVSRAHLVVPGPWGCLGATQASSWVLFAPAPGAAKRPQWGIFGLCVTQHRLGMAAWPKALPELCLEKLRSTFSTVSWGDLA